MHVASVELNTWIGHRDTHHTRTQTHNKKYTLTHTLTQTHNKKDTITHTFTHLNVNSSSTGQGIIVVVAADDPCIITAADDPCIVAVSRTLMDHVGMADPRSVAQNLIQLCAELDVVVADPRVWVGHVRMACAHILSVRLCAELAGDSSSLAQKQPRSVAHNLIQLCAELDIVVADPRVWVGHVRMACARILSVHLCAELAGDSSSLAQRQAFAFPLFGHRSLRPTAMMFYHFSGLVFVGVIAAMHPHEPFKAVRLYTIFQRLYQAVDFGHVAILH